MDFNNIKNIIFDLGGVICDLLPEKCLSQFKGLGCDVEIFPQQYSQFSGLFQQIDRGTISGHDFCEGMRIKNNAPQLTDRQICDAWNSLIGPVADNRFEAFKTLRKHFNLYILSNTNEIHWKYVTENTLIYRGEDASTWFKRIFLSYELHLEKPEIEIYQTVVDTAQINPEETLFIDDNLINLKGAEQIGIKTLLSTNGDWVDKLLGIVKQP